MIDRRLRPYLPRGFTAALTAVALVQGALIIAQADLLSRALADLDTGPLLALVVVVALRAGLTWVRGATARGGAARAKARLRAALHARAAVPGRPPAGENHGESVTVIVRGLDALDAYITDYLPRLMVAAVVPLAVLGRLGYGDWPSALIIAVTLPLIPVFGALIGLRTKEVTERQWSTLRRLGGHFLDVVTGLATLRSYGRDGVQTTVVGDMADRHRRATMRALRVAFLSSAALELVSTLSVALVAVPAGLRLLDGSLDLRTALLVLLLAPEAYLPLRALGTGFHASAEGRAVLAQAFGTDPSAAGRPFPTDEGTPHIDRAPGAPSGVTLAGVSVRYPGRDGFALDRVSLEVRPGERVAVTGPSGAGKTTLLRALLGFVGVEGGRVLVGDTDPALDPATCRRMIAYVPQRPHLFAATVADNIRLGRPDASDAAVRDAAEAAAAHDFIAALPEGYATPLGERGLGLSTGQRQRLAIARAYLLDAPVVLLDEPTARLDLASEAAIVDATARLLDGRTAVLVAHRPALLAVADREIRLDDGVLGELRMEVTA